MLQESYVLSEVTILHLGGGSGSVEELTDIAMHVSLSRNQAPLRRLCHHLIVSPVYVSPPFPDSQLFESTLWNSGKVKEAE